MNFEIEFYKDEDNTLRDVVEHEAISFFQATADAANFNKLARVGWSTKAVSEILPGEGFDDEDHF